MSIEDDLRSLKTDTRNSHKAELRLRLITDMKEKDMKKHNNSLRWFVTLMFVSLAAIALAIGLSLWQPKINNSVVKGITAQEVFAKAADQVTASPDLAEGQWFYQSRMRTTGQTRTCGLTKEIEGSFWRKDGVNVETRKNASTHALIEQALFFPQGVDMSNLNSEQQALYDKYHYFNREAADPKTYTQTETCQSKVWQDDEYSKAYSAYLVKLNEAYLGRKLSPEETSEKPLGMAYLTDLRSADPAVQARVFTKLESANLWTVKEDTQFDSYNGKVIELSFDAGSDYFDHIYFDQSTKKFVGFEHNDLSWGYDTWLVLESGKKVNQVE